MLTLPQVEQQLLDSRAVCNIGQLGPVALRALARAVKRGELEKYRGYWDTLHPAYGMGPLKSCWRVREGVVAVALR